jgi:hypothetical protein
MNNNFGNNRLNFLIKKKDGIKYSKTSKDNNKIHINEKYGYNSIFGECIVHGTHLISKFLKKIKFKLNDTSLLNIDLINPFFYEKKIFIKIKKNNFSSKYFLFQKNRIAAKIIITKNSKANFNEQISNFDNIFSFRVRKIKKKNQLDLVLRTLSKYVGKIFPAENSLISNIKIYYHKKIHNKILNKFEIKSKILKKNYPIILNSLNFNNYYVEFETLVRPSTNYGNKITKISKNLKNHILKIKENILIIGASQGIGREVYNIVKSNNKIKKIITYNKNKISYKLGKNTSIIKINIKKDLNKIIRFINRFEPIRVYYFPSTKIYFDNNLTLEEIKNYKNFFVKIPMEILRRSQERKIFIFYPSTSNIDLNNRSLYSKIKLCAEKEISKFCKKNNLYCSIHRFPAIYSRQSVSMLNPKPQSLVDYLGSDFKKINSIFPLKFSNKLRLL